MTLAAAKAAMRTSAYAARSRAHGVVDPAPALARAEAWLTAVPDVRCISAYVAIRTEIDPRALMERLHTQGYRLCLPVVVAPETPLIFREWVPGMALVKGAFGAPIPRDGTAQVVPDAVITPLLSFDQRGYRLGYGGGYYDRTLAQLRTAGPVPAIGLAYGAQQVPKVPIDATDIALDAIATETGLITP